MQKKAALQQIKARKTRVRQLRKTDDVDAFLHYIYNSDGLVTEVWGYGVIHGTRDRADGARNHRRKVTGQSIKDAEAFVENAIIDDWNRTQPGNQESEEESFETILKRVVKEHNDEIRFLARQNFGWSEGTIQISISFLTYTVSKYIKDRWTNMADVVEDIVNKSMTHGNSNGERDKVCLDIQNKLKRTKKLFSLIQNEYGVLEEYSLNFPVISFGQVAQREQVKSVKKTVRSTYLYALWELALRGVALAFGAAMMYFCGLRTGEAVAPLIGDIEISADGRYALYLARSQVKRGKRTEYMKTEQSYRLVILPYGMVRFVQLRIKQLRENGYSDADIARIPLVSFGDEKEVFVKEGLLSGFVRALLALCGGPKETALKEAGMAEKEDLKCIGEENTNAYIQRRDFASRSINDCGITPAETDYLLGHKSTEVGYETVLAKKGTEQWCASIAGRLERYVTCPEFSLSPAVVPVKMKPGQEIDLQGGAEYIFQAEEDCVVDLAAYNMEANDYKYMSTEGGLSEAELRCGTKLEDQKSRPYRMTSFGVQPSEGEMEECKEKGKEIAESVMKGSAFDKWVKNVKTTPYDGKMTILESAKGKGASVSEQLLFASA